MEALQYGASRRGNDFLLRSAAHLAGQSERMKFLTSKIN
jgi:hypothetical protein